MSGTRKVAGLAMVAALCLIVGSGLSAVARAQAPAAGGQDRRGGEAAVYDAGVQFGAGLRK